MKKRIILDPKIQLDIARSVGVTDRMVRAALSYGSNTELARSIRAIAVEKGGKMVGVEELRTSYPVGQMVQTYGGRLRIETNLSDGVTIVYVDGVIQEQQTGLSIDEYSRLQERYIRKINIL